ncbi:MAG TPA: 4-hydroxy-tetrahydrodipicolinate synthase [Acidobacteriaceae bacterium]|nr:4-hydroxy-tetrahydrodipicolinate synthase [Acidobacteriaceae bacterium]
MELSGCGTALVTPFLSNGDVDWHALQSLVRWQIESGIHFLVPTGSTGEACALLESEWLRLVSVVVEAAEGRVPIFVGCSHNTSQQAIARVKKLQAIPGVDGVLTANPYYTKPTQEGQYLHFRAIAENTHLQVLLYNIPSRTGINLLPETTARLAEIPNVVGIKESSGNLQQITEVVHAVPDHFKVFAGDDNLALPILSVGGTGVISVAANAIPAQMTRMVDAALNHDWDLARQLYRKYYPLIIGNFIEPNPQPVKCVLALMGRIQEEYRLPMMPVVPKTKAHLEKLVHELGLLEPVAAGKPPVTAVAAAASSNA